MNTTQPNATARAADTLLRALGGRTVILRMPAPAVPADPTEQLGLATPLFQDIPLAPAVYRKARATISLPNTDATNGGAPSKLGLGGSVRSELLVSATAVERIVGSLSYASASVLFANAAGILAEPAPDSATDSVSATNSGLLQIVAVSCEEAHGQPYVYRLILRTPSAQQT